jgi:hypothetical protein
MGPFVGGFKDGGDEEVAEGKDKVECQGKDEAGVAAE